MADHKYQIKHKYIIPALLFAGITLIALGFIVKDDGENKEAVSDVSLEESWEARVEELCLSVSGIGSANAFVTLDGDEDKSSSSPNVRGVAVTVTGGDSPIVQKTVVELISSALGIPSSRVAVAEAKMQ